MDSQEIQRILTQGEDGLEGEELLVYNLMKAQAHAQKALNLCYQPKGPKRSLWYRMVLGRAQSILISLSVRELKG